MELKLQLHLHTIESKGTRIPRESVITPKNAIDIIKKNNIDIVAITDHNSTTAYSKIKQYAKKKGILVINGIEANTLDGHLIGLGIDSGIEKRLNKNMSALEVSDIIRSSGGEVYIPHPFDIRKEGLGIKIREIDGIVEVFNSMNIFGFEDKFADIVASRLSLPKAVGADAHTPGMIDSGITVIDSELDEVSILKSLRKGKTRFEDCRYMTLREMKEWVLERTTSSYEFVVNNIRHDWIVDRWYMNIANFKTIKILEKKVLDFGVKNKKSKFWDFITYLSYITANFYGQLSKKEFYGFISTL
jgi:predicted metal-dependent phosphoesterase TrpH